MNKYTKHNRTIMQNKPLYNLDPTMNNSIHTHTIYMYHSVLYYLFDK
jgi:hypothetical protein